MHHALFQAVHHLYVVEVDDDATGRAARDLCDFVCLDGHLNVFETGEEGELEMVPGLRDAVK